MTSQDLHLLSAAYALDAVDDDERTKFAAHLETCPDCQEEVAGFRRTLTRLSGASAEVPRPDLRDNVLTTISQTRQATPWVPADIAPIGRRHANRSWQGWAAAAAAVVAVAAGGFGWQQHSQSQHIRDDYSRAQAQTAAMQRILAEPDVRAEHARNSSGSEMTVYRSARAAKAVVVPATMPALAANQVYQLWVVAKGTPLPRQVMTGRPEIVDGVHPGDAIAVTVEPAGGSLVPSGPPVLQANA